VACVTCLALAGYLGQGAYWSNPRVPEPHPNTWAARER
jgi:hypothetical protein